MLRNKKPLSPKAFKRKVASFYSSYDKNFIFVRIPKNASTSIVNQLKIGELAHISYLYLTEIGLDPKGYFTFAFVRNPWDRLVSWYFYHRQHYKPGIHNEEYGKYYRELDFNQWIKQGCPRVWGETKNNLRPNPLIQTDWILDKDNNIGVDFVGKIENLNKDIQYIENKLKHKILLPNLNRSNHKNRKDYYTDETIEIAATMFKKDIEHFGYSF